MLLHIDKHISNAVFYTASLSLGGGGLQPPESPLNPHMKSPVHSEELYMKKQEVLNMINTHACPTHTGNGQGTEILVILARIFITIIAATIPEI